MNAVRLGDALTRRELQVLAEAASGRTNAEIGGRLCISTQTVKTHVQHVLRKLGAENRAHAVAIGCAAGLITYTATPKGVVS